LNIFKKTDSTLRGNIGAELKALLETTGERSIVFVPAFPEMGRTTRNRIHYVHGVPLVNTEFGIDPLSPVRSSDIAEVLQMNASIPVRTATDIADIAGEGCYVLDCESRDQMRAIAHRLEQADRLRLLSGSAAFAEELSHLLPLPRSIPESIILQRPILLVNGSLNPRSFEQISALEEGFEIVRLSADALRDEHPRFELAPNRGGNVLLCSIDNRDSYAAFRDRARQLGISDNELHHRVAAANGRSVKALMADRTFRTLFVIGGDTLIGIAREMKWTAFEPCGEIEAGVTASRPQGQNILVLSKAGGFGDRNVLKRIMANLAH
jgi:uncharacterized protein YgbK (DUF1537 family)